MSRRTYMKPALRGEWKPKSVNQQLEELFNSAEEMEIASGLDAEIRASRKTCLECAGYLLMANHTGDKMDILADLHRKGLKYGLSEKQHAFAADIMVKHMPRLIELIADAAEGKDIVAQMVVEDAVTPTVTRGGRTIALAETTTEDNPLFGMF